MTLRNEACIPELGDAWTTDLLSIQFSGVEHDLLGLVQAYGLAHRLLIAAQNVSCWSASWTREQKA
jgi:hypothetical protein